MYSFQVRLDQSKEKSGPGCSKLGSDDPGLVCGLILDLV